jgi:regulator of protease activity HflC (stomatin/prohibitin superfamily)
MFDKLFEFIKTIWNELVFWIIVPEMQSACILRFGKFHRVLNRGIFFKMPFADSVYQFYIVTQTTHLNPQTLTTKDGKSVVVKAIVRFHIENIKDYTLRVWDAHDAIGDTVQGIINNSVKNLDWSKVLNGIEEDATQKAHEILSEWGIKVEKITLSDLALIKTIRIIGNTQI